MFRKYLSCFCSIIALTIAAHSQIPKNDTPPGSNAPKDGRDADRAAIMTEIGRITQAFIDGDNETVYKTHSEDWSGFLSDPQTIPIYGINEYLKGNGITWPLSPSYKKPAPNPYPNLHYRITNSLITFVTNDVGVASFTLDYPWRDGVNFTRLRIMDVFTKRDGKWIQTASDTATDPQWKGDQASIPREPAENSKQAILATREAVWKAWFAGDVEKLGKMIPDEIVSVEGPKKEWENRAAMLAASKAFVASGARLIRLEFPKTDVQFYGNTIVLFTSYSYDIQKDGKKSTITGKGVETFIIRGQKLLNIGWIL
nr:hypothetical protein [uncultured bacterium]